MIALAPVDPAICWGFAEARFPSSVLGVGVGFEESHLQDMFYLDRGTGASPNLLHFCIDPYIRLVRVC